MIRYALLVRGINVGGKNKVVMAQLCQELTELRLENVETYINSGNIFFDTNMARIQLVEDLKGFFERLYPFIQNFIRKLYKPVLFPSYSYYRHWPVHNS